MGAGREMSCFLVGLGVLGLRRGREWEEPISFVFFVFSGGGVVLHRRLLFLVWGVGIRGVYVVVGPAGGEVLYRTNGNMYDWGELLMEKQG